MKKCEKRSGCGGFTLAETLLATLILLLVSMLMANGIPTVKGVYERVTIGANAKVLLSTTISALRNEVGTAKAIQVDRGGKYLTYYSTQINARARIYQYDPAADFEGEEEDIARRKTDTPEKTIMLQEYIKTSHVDLAIGANAQGLGVPRRLVPAVSATEKLYATFDSVEASNDMVVFHGLKVLRQGDAAGTVYAKLDDLNIRVTIGPITVIN